MPVRLRWRRPAEHQNRRGAPLRQSDRRAGAHEGSERRRPGGIPGTARAAARRREQRRRGRARQGHAVRSGRAALLSDWPAARRRDAPPGADHHRRRDPRSTRGQDVVAAAGVERGGRLRATPGSRRSEDRAAEAGERPGGRSAVAVVTRVFSGRQGATSMGCLVSLLFLVAALYYGVNIGELFFRYYRLLDEMQTQAQLAPSLDDGTIRRRIQAAVQDIGLPPEAQQIKIARRASPREIVIETEYAEPVTLPLFTRPFTLHPKASQPLWRPVSTAEKIRAAEAAARWRQRHPGPVVFTNGVFDLLHVGHVALLEAARAEGAALIVGVNSDASVRRLGKGSGGERPVVPERERARLVAALAAVDCVVVFDEDTPLALIERLRPDVLVKGADYARDAIVGADQVEAWGGRVVRVPLVAGVSTTDLLARLRGGAGR